MSQPFRVAINMGIEWGAQRQVLGGVIRFSQTTGGLLNPTACPWFVFRHFAFYGIKPYLWAQEREEAFCRQVKQAGGTLAVFHTAPDMSDEVQQGPLVRWLTHLPRPLAVMACDDARGRHILTACLELNLNVPLQAATLLDTLMRRQRCPVRNIRIAPQEVVTRESTDILATADPQVGQALQMIRQLAHRPLGVKELLAEIPVSRRTLERRFMAVMGRRPAEEIRRVRLERATFLLRTTNLAVTQIARECGFSDLRNMDQLFRRELKVSPSAYHRQARQS